MDQAFLNLFAFKTRLSIIVKYITPVTLLLTFAKLCNKAGSVLMGKHTAAIRAVPLIQVNERATKNDGDLKMMATCLVVSKKSWRGFERGSGRGWVVVVVVGGGGG